jgi:peptidoglycan/LPS O-acetylase OafA/YrhL
VSDAATPEAAIHSDRRLPALTGMRIFAALAVYLSHVGPPHGSPEVLKTFMESGYAGVTVFFVLSGFVLAVNYFREMTSLHLVPAYNYFIARIARVYPLYVLLLFYFVVSMHAHGESVSGWWRNLLVIQTWSPDIAHAYSFDAPSWSVSVEFFLYACFPLLIPLFARLRSARSILTAAGVVAAAMLALTAWFALSGKGHLSMLDPASAHRWLYRTPLTRLGDFALGILAAQLFTVCGRQPRVMRWSRVLAPLMALLIVALMCWRTLFFTAWSWDVAYAIPAVVLIFALASEPRGLLAALLSIPAIVLLGEASYAFYLVHSPAISFFGAGMWTTSVTPTIVLLEALNLALAVGLHYTIELPARKKVRRLLTISGNRFRRARAT